MTPVAVASGISLTAIAGVFIAFQANRLIEAQNELLKTQTSLLESQTKQIGLQTMLSEANRRASSAYELANVLEAIAKAVEGKTGKTKLSPALYGRIAALSRTLRPYKYLEDTGELCENPLSPERGQLLVSLIAAGIDLDPIRGDADFTHAGLDSANLRGAVLVHLNLSSSSLRDANLAHADLRGAYLKNVDLRGADLEFADLSGYDNGVVSCPCNTDGVKWKGANLSFSLLLGPVPKQAENEVRLDYALSYQVDSESGSVWKRSEVSIPNELESFPLQIVRDAYSIASNNSEEKILEYAKARMEKLVQYTGGPPSQEFALPAFPNEPSGDDIPLASYAAIPESIRRKMRWRTDFSSSR